MEPSIVLIYLFFIILTLIIIQKIYIIRGETFKTDEIKCYNDPLTLAKCHITKENPCPDKNGSFMQCTNNFKREVNIADCLERSYYYSKANERLSEKCIYKNVFPFAIKKPQESTSNPSIFPRINIYRNKDL